MVTALENVLFERLSARLGDTASAPSGEGWEAFTRSEPFRQAVAREAAATDSGDKTREAIGEVLQSALFESGILEKLIAKQVESRVGEADGGGGVSGAQVQDILATTLPQLLQSELKGIVQKQVKATVAGEEMKVLIDDKFRAISLYLKSDVIPKAVQKILQESGQTA
jgi:hypothetical protein